ncbi:MAG: DUF378 domain-containing protein [Patescibacteria group bacterium]
MHKIAFVLLVIGGLNWGLEAAGYGIGNYIPEGLALVIYVLVALSAIYEAFSHKGNCKNCSAQGAM